MRTDLNSELQRLVAVFQQAPVGRQLADLGERNGRCYRSATRFLSLLRGHDLDGDVLCWARDDWSHVAVRPHGGQFVVDWTASQFEPDPSVAARMDWPLMRTKAEMDGWLDYESYILQFEAPFFRSTPLIPEPMLPWSQARLEIESRDPSGPVATTGEP